MHIKKGGNGNARQVFLLQKNVCQTVGLRLETLSW